MIIRKIYLSIMISILCLITLVTATFAWIGFLEFSSFEKFEINLNSTELEEYGIEISLTGEDGTFGSSVDQMELQKIILKNYGYNETILNSKTKAEINALFNGMNLKQCSVIPNADKSFPDFVDISNDVTTKYFKFDIYVSVFRAYDYGSTSEYFLDAYLKGNLFEGTKQTRDLANKFTYPSDFVNNVRNGIKADTVISKNVCVDSSSACRLSIQKYEVVDKYHPEQYSNTSAVQDLIIFQGGTANPTYDPDEKVYSFGGIMPDKYNLALYDWNKKFPEDIKKVPTELFSRGDIEYTPKCQVIDSSKAEEKIGVNQMMKMTICFWFEGWDADCFDAIDNSPVAINLNFSTNNRDY